MQGKKKHSDQDIIDGCLKNSRKYQELLYRKYFPTCFYMCLRFTKDQDIAKMIVHDGFLKVYQNLDRFASTGSLQSWIKRIVFNSLSDHFRKESKYLKMFVFDDYEKKDDLTALSNLYYDDLINLLAQLTYIQKEVFMLFAIEGYSHREIGKKLTISEANSKWHLHQARKALKELLKKQKKISNHA